MEHYLYKITVVLLIQIQISSALARMRGGARTAASPAVCRGAADRQSYDGRRGEWGCAPQRHPLMTEHINLGSPEQQLGREVNEHTY